MILLRSEEDTSETDSGGSSGGGGSVAPPADTTGPTVSGVRFVSSNGSYGIGTQNQLEVSFSENVKINGSMTLTLQLDGQQFLQHFHLMDLLH